VFHRRFSIPPEPVAEPRPRTTNPQAYAFVAFPLAACQGLMPEPPQAVQWIYRQAFEQAQAVLRPSWIERDPLGVWN